MLFFCHQGKANRDKSLLELKTHLKKSYIPRERKWMVLFPEGGFLRKRKEISQRLASMWFSIVKNYVSNDFDNPCRFAEKNNLPVLNNVTVPRVGAMKAIVDVLGSLDSSCQDEEKMMNSSYVDSTIATVTDEFNHSLMDGTIIVDQQQQQQPKQNDVTNNSSSTIINSEAISTDDCGEYPNSIYDSYIVGHNVSSMRFCR